MAHERFFHTQNISGDTLTFENEEHFHLSRVLRKNRGDTVWAIDGEGIAYRTRIRSVEKQQSTAEILRRHPGFGEPSNRVSLAVGIIKPSHWEILLEKAVELGVHDIFPLHTRYTVKGNIKRERSEKILLSAVKQCGRSRIPRLHPVREFREFIRATRNERQYICDNQENYPRLQPEKEHKDVLLLVGPEGGFHPDEVTEAVKYSVHPVTLSTRRLRTETACFAALNILVK